MLWWTSFGLFTRDWDRSQLSDGPWAVIPLQRRCAVAIRHRPELVLRHPAQRMRHRPLDIFQQRPQIQEMEPIGVLNRLERLFGPGVTEMLHDFVENAFAVLRVLLVADHQKP